MDGTSEQRPLQGTILICDAFRPDTIKYENICQFLCTAPFG
jgi:hypothetical protein